jgi:hypothetical protein
MLVCNGRFTSSAEIAVHFRYRRTRPDFKGRAARSLCTGRLLVVTGWRPALHMRAMQGAKSTDAVASHWGVGAVPADQEHSRQAFLIRPSREASQT